MCCSNIGTLYFDFMARWARELMATYPYYYDYYQNQKIPLYLHSKNKREWLHVKDKWVDEYLLQLINT